MSKRNEDKKSKQDREIELLKVQIYADRCHNRFISLLTIPWAFFISFSIVFFTLYLENTISLRVFLALEILVGVFLLYESYTTRKDYKKGLKNVSEMIEIVKEGKELPRLEDLKNIGKDIKNES